MRRHLWLIGAAALTLLAGCAGGAQDPQVASAGGGGATTTTAAATDPAADNDERMRQFAACMREHGVDMPDPEPGGGPVRVGVGPGDADPQKMDEAMNACRSLMPNGGEPPKLSPEDLEKARAMAACMREHGVDVPDPDPDQGGVVIRRGGPGDGAPPDEDTMRAAFEACRHLGPQLGGDGPSVSTGGGR